MISGLIPHRYAMALYKYARETGSQQPIYEAMKTVLAAYSDNKDLQKTMSNPYVKGEDKRKVLDGLCQAKPDSPFDRFVQLVLDHKREEFFQLMALAYRDIYRKENNISQVRIVTAVEIPDTEMKRLHDVVEKSFPKSVVTNRRNGVRPAPITVGETTPRLTRWLQSHKTKRMPP